MTDNTNPDNNKQAFFEVDSRLLFQLGEQLVSNKSIALAELVKNSYDADATQTDVILNDVKNKIGGTIIIKDNGIGISPERFTKTWMRIATIDSEENPISKKYGRQRAGEKGIGRIACRKLAKELKLTSVSENENKEKIKISAHFIWADFFAGSNLNQIPVNYTIEIINSAEPTGTELILINTTEKWTETNAKRLNAELWDLFTPKIFTEEKIDENNDKRDPGFTYNINSEEFGTFTDTVTEQFLKNCWAKIKGTVDEFGNATYELQTLNKLVNPIKYIHQKDETFQLLKNSTMEIYLIKYTDFFFKNSTLKRNEAFEIGHDRGGVKVYADGFRVFGYGEVGNDWLKIYKDRSRSIGSFKDESDKIQSEDKRPGLQLFDYRNLFGYVNYDKKSNPGLSISINRESLDETPNFAELAEFVRLGINIATVKYSDERLKYDNLEKERKKAEERKIIEREILALRLLEEEKKKAKEEEERIAADKTRLEIEAKKRNEEFLSIQKERELAALEKEKIEQKKREAEKKARFKNTQELWLKVDQLRQKEQEKEEAEKKIIETEKNLSKEYVSVKNQLESIASEQLKVNISNFEIIKKHEEEFIESQKEKIKIKEKNYDEALSILRVLASTGTTIFIFTHEIQSFMGDLVSLNSNVKILLSKITDLDSEERKYYEQMSDRLEEKIKVIKELSNFIGLSGGNESRSELRRWSIRPQINTVFKPFDSELEKRGIDFENAVPERLRSPSMYRSELIAVFVNLMTNAVKAVTNQRTKKIKVTAEEIKDEKISIKFMDTGKGLDIEKRESVFEPFVTYSDPDMNFGIGTGLGLKIVKDIITGYNGDIKFIDPPAGWKTCIEIILPLV